MKSKEQKRVEAQQRQTAYDALSKAEKFALLRARPGNSDREYDRITKQVNR